MPAGWSFPWGLRARLAELLLRGMFDTLDEGQYTEHRQELLGLLQGSVWRQLQIPPDVHNAVFAWVHYRQVGWPASVWVGGGDVGMLEAACACWAMPLVSPPHRRQGMPCAGRHIIESIHLLVTTHAQPVSTSSAVLPACLQFAVSEDLLLLEVARQATQQVKPGALPLAQGGSPGGPGGSPLLVTKGELGAGVAAGSGLAPRCRLALFAPLTAFSAACPAHCCLPAWYPMMHRSTMLSFPAQLPAATTPNRLVSPTAHPLC